MDILSRPQSGLPFVFDLLLLKTNPAHHTSHKTMLLAHEAQLIDNSFIHESKVPSVHWDIYSGQPSDQSVIRNCG